MKCMEKGISLMMLVITIIVIIILAGVVILSLQKNNPLRQASKARFLNDVETFKEDLELYKENQYLKNNDGFNPETLNAPVESLYIYDVIPSLKNSLYEADEFIVKNGKLVYKGTNSDYIQWIKDVGVDQNSAPTSKGENTPELANGMTPIKWTNGIGDPVSTTASDSTWYDYTNKQWANAITKDGSMWVWIPRYEYKIPIKNYHTSNAGTIDIKFIQTAQTVADSGYIIEPAFIFGTTQLSGIWVAKFEASGSANSVEIKPNVSSLRNITISDIFKACRNMETNKSKYGWNSNEVDTHLMKNVEWGACAYLAQSSYGKNSKIWINSNVNSITGQVGTSSNSSNTTSTYSYNDTTYGVNASTTGNVYGIYDMSGGVWEYVAAYVDSGSSLLDADAKYKDVYTSNGDTLSGNYSAASNRVGDALYETSLSGINNTSWYNEYSYMPYSSAPFFRRGGNCNDAEKAGLFYFSNANGNGGSDSGFRPVITVTGIL